MKFAAPYHHTQSLIPHSDIDEYNIVFKENSNFDELKQFMELFPNKRVNIEFAAKEYDIDTLIEFCQTYDNLYVRLKPKDLQYLKRFDDEAVKYFFDDIMKIYSYGTLEWVFLYHPTDIYISDDLTYNISEVYKQCREHDIALRIVLNKVPTINSAILQCPTAQIYRPQDYEFLSRFYSTGEFDCGEGTYDWTRAEVWYRRWYIEHYWDDTLDYMNLDVAIPYPTVSMPPELTKIRANCKHRCTMSAENMCHKCHRLVKMGFYNADNGIVYTDSEHSLPSLEKMVDSIITSKDDNVN